MPGGADDKKSASILNGLPRPQKGVLRQLSNLDRNTCVFGQRIDAFRVVWLGFVACAPTIPVGKISFDSNFESVLSAIFGPTCPRLGIE